MSATHAVVAVQRKNIERTGARMKIPWKGRLASRRPSTSSGASKDSTWDPKPLRSMATEMPPSSSWPPFFAPSIVRARRIAPAQVPQMGFVFRNSRIGSSSPAKRARSAIVVDSTRGIGSHDRQRAYMNACGEDAPPPGMISASHLSRSSCWRTSTMTTLRLSESFCSIT